MSQACASQLLCQLEVFPEFFKYLRAFGRKKFARDEGFSGCDIRITRDSMGLAKSIGTVSLQVYKFLTAIRIVLYAEICGTA